MIAIVDYGVGNLFSLAASLRHLGLESTVTGDADAIARAERIILPGVGAFGDAITKLRATGLVPTLDRAVAGGTPLLGICLGMQLLFEKSGEYGDWAGLSYLAGYVAPLAGDIPPALKVPQMGWNALEILDEKEPLLKYTRPGEHVYYVHSYYVKGCENSLKAGSRYGVFVPGVVRAGNVWGAQFHPEKSGTAGLAMLKAFGEGVG
ncbi:MAG: imidazole glycerol phosphate synthase subunit HisH [Firmicutes bacterium]|nr:imidazole glycerol phosphate synthase subunit HisH [Bacillota bacterium]